MVLNTNRHRIATAFALRLHSMSKAEAEPSFVLPGVKELTLVKRPEGSRERHSAPFNFRFKVTVCTDSTCEPTSISISNGNTLKISKKQNFVLEFSVRHLGDWGRGKCCSWGAQSAPLASPLLAERETQRIYTRAKVDERRQRLPWQYWYHLDL